MLSNKELGEFALKYKEAFLATPIELNNRIDS